MNILQKINGHEDLLHLSDNERTKLCAEIREFLITNISKTGGHLAGNLGAVELTVAIETVFDTMKDRLVFDVGHQSYVHKMLTGRQADFAHLRQYGGLSGFPKPSESNADAFVAGHASSSVSIALGMARARTLLGDDYNVIALIGDGAATGGMAFEGLNDAAVSREPMVIILNDNEMSIGKNVGGVSRHLSRLRSSSDYIGAKRWYRNTIKKLPAGESLYKLTSHLKNRIKRFLLKTTIFENMGFTYLGPVDGHDLPGLISILHSAKEMQEPVLVHVDSFGETVVELAQSNPKVCAITAAMPGGTGLLDLMKKYPERLFDVGIAEEHAVSMAGGLAKQGMIPIVALYSTFLQRAYDQIFQDVAMLGLHVVFAIDRAGLVGDDGPTHHGVFDVGFLRQVPGMLVLNPVSYAEQQDMLRWAVEEYNGPVAIRYPRGSEGSYCFSDWNGSNPKAVKCHRTGADITFITYGSMLDNIMKAADLLSHQGIEACIIRLLNLSNFDVDQMYEYISESGKVIIVEEMTAGSGIGESLFLQLKKKFPAIHVETMDLGNDFVPHGAQTRLYEHCGLNEEAIAHFAKEMLSYEN